MAAKWNGVNCGPRQITGILTNITATRVNESCWCYDGDKSWVNGSVPILKLSIGSSHETEPCRERMRGNLTRIVTVQVFDCVNWLWHITLQSGIDRQPILYKFNNTRNIPKVGTYSAIRLVVWPKWFLWSEREFGVRPTNSSCGRKRHANHAVSIRFGRQVSNQVGTAAVTSGRSPPFHLTAGVTTMMTIVARWLAKRCSGPSICL